MKVYMPLSVVLLSPGSMHLPEQEVRERMGIQRWVSGLFSVPLYS